MKRKNKNILFSKSLIYFGTGITTIFVGLVVIWVSSIKIPDFQSFNERKIANSTKIYDKTGEVLLFDIHQDIKRTYITFDQMGANIKNATVAVEDSEFYNHNGIRIPSIFRATILAKLTGKKVTGASTITQQLVKNTLLTSDRTILRKIKEWVLAVKIDKSMPKEKILEYYLNEAPYGGTIYGVEEASKTYFGKSAQDLSLVEAAYLASIPQSPTKLSPYGKNKDKLTDRKNFVLSRMLDVKFISQDEYEMLKKEVIEFQPQATMGIRAPHFVFFIKDYLEQKYGADMVENGGLKVITTLDYNLQEKAEQILKDGSLENEKNWNGSNSGLVAIDPKNGQILTMVGSRNYFDKEIDGNYNIVTASRQPGSSFKPFIYATAFDKGFTPDTVLFDLPTEFQTTCDAYGKALPGKKQSDCYKPDNYDGKFRGPLTLKAALAQSINIPAIKLLYLVGLKDSLKTSQDMGITTLTDPSRYGLTLVIGGGEVSLLDITSAYGVFANNGIRNNYTGILKVETNSGKILEEYKQKERAVIQKNTALIISDILSDNDARTPTFGTNSVLEIAGSDVAVKTGTTNNNKDAWTIGYTPSIAVGVWAGNNDNKPMKKGGSAVAGPMWNKFIKEAINILPKEGFEKPNLGGNEKEIKPILRGFWQGNENFFIDKVSGKLATEFTPKETVVEKVITNVHSILYWVDRSDIKGPPPTNPRDNQQFEHWEIPVQNWWSQNRYKYQIVTRQDIPKEFDNIHTSESKPQITIIEPNSYTNYLSNQKIQLQIRNSGMFPLQKIDIFINDVFLSSVKNPFNFSFIPSELENLRKNNEIKIISYDSAFNHNETISFFSIID